MKPSVPFAACLLALAQGSVVAADFKIGDHNFTLPDGFEIELVAGPPLTDRPINADFDEQGRLYIADSSGSNDKVDQQLVERPHRVVRLEDVDGDGRFDKTQVFADKMMFPEGALWYDGSLYVAAPPSIWKLTDTDGDGVADKRGEWFQGKTLTGCANDLHGPYLGLDGWIYWCKGAFAEQRYERPGKAPFVTRAAHIFRARPDGSGIEPVLTGGMDNPVSVAFTAGGERILTGTFFQRPGGGKRDGLIHAIYGGVYGKENDVLDGHKKTGDLMPIMTHHGPSASTYVIRYRSAALGAGFQDNLFACLFNLRKITRHILTPDGATFRTTDSDFLVSDNPDFHPTQLIEDADGSLLVVDTGGWYKICCPTSQLWKPDVLGAIYRVRKQGAPKLPDARGRKIDWAKLNATELANLVGDPRPAVQDQAMHRLGKAGDDAVPALAAALKDNSTLKRCNAVWALTRIDAGGARAAVRTALNDADATVRQAALHSISAWRDASAVPRLIEMLQSEGAPLKRVAAEALGRIGDKRAVPTLLAAAGRQLDRVGEHAIIFALIEIADSQGTSAGLASASTRRAALIALDQMDGSGLKPEIVTTFLESNDAALKKTAAWILGLHPEWGGALGDYYKQRLAKSSIATEELAELSSQLVQFTATASIQQLVANAAADAKTDVPVRTALLNVMERARPKETPAAWVPVLTASLKETDPRIVQQAVLAARALPGSKPAAPELSEALLTVGRSSTQPSHVRLAALAAVPGGLKNVDAAVFDFLCENLDPAKAVALRSSAVEVLAKARLSEEQLLRLADALKGAGPMEVPRLLTAFDKGANEAIGLKLVSSLKESSGLSGVRPEVLRPRLTNFPEVVQQKGEELLATLNVDGEKQRARVDELLAGTKDGDVRRGQAIFNGTKAACSSCHAIGYVGGNLGPDLTRIGQIRSERDLLEAVVYPSASFVRSYEPFIVATTSGDDHSGILRKDAADEIVLATGPDTEVRVPRAEIAQMRPGSVSTMPSGLDEQLTRQELADLLAFLKATRW